MLAYVFWHRPEAAADSLAYEDAQRSFHAAVEVPSASFGSNDFPSVREGLRGLVPRGAPGGFGGTQLVLGPAAEFCGAALAASSTRTRI
jgi:hypothetical protein